MAPDCIFCKIAAKEVASDIVYESDQVVAFPDINPQAPVHLLVIPKKHIANIGEIGSEDQDLLYQIGEAVKKLAEQYQLEDGYRLVTNCGTAAGQTVNHLHFHLLGGRNLTWPPG
ncbi:MAG: histidine triad nucleotide-binding protein [Firmicutes bacterium]|nr:histidine triad nucleotide-binding protein [Bacillota bacterium]